MKEYHGPMRPSPEIMEEMDRVYGETSDQEEAIFRGSRGPKRPTEKEIPPDVVVLPAHYSRFRFEPVHFARENQLSFLETNVVKYLLRAPYKHKDIRVDYSKSIRCTIMECKYRLGDPNWWKPYKTNIEACLKEELSYGE